MNIFVLDYNHSKNAEYHVDKHVVKMITEYTQILSTVCRLNGYERGYRTAYQNHPCVVWVNQSRDNWLWLYDLLYTLHEEWQYRYGHIRNHKAYNMALTLPVPYRLPQQGITPFTQAMPEQYKSTCAVSAYRAYYKGEKQHLFKWTKRLPPPWLE